MYVITICYAVQMSISGVVISTSQQQQQQLVQPLSILQRLIPPISSYCPPNMLRNKMYCLARCRCQWLAGWWIYLIIANTFDICQAITIY